MAFAAGIDYGIRRVAISIPKKNIFEEGLFDKDTDIDNLFEISAWAGDIILKHKPNLVIVEKPIQGISGNVRTGLSLGMVAGSLVFSSKLLVSNVDLVAPSSWKKEVVGSGNADKQKVAKWLEQNHEKYYKECKRLKSPQDCIDATCMALYGEKILAR